MPERKKPRAGTVYEHHSQHHRIRVIESEGVRTLRFARNQQSSMRVDDPFETDIEYIGYLHLTLALCPRAERTLAVGLGGGSVVKRMWRDYPAMHIDVAEIDAEVAETARAFFALPDSERISIAIADGREFLKLTTDTYDIIIIDAFDEDRVPHHLQTEEFMREVRERLSPEGVVAYNFIGAVYGQRSKPFRSLHRTACNVWRSVWTFPVGLGDDVADTTRNIILLASDIDLGVDELLDRIASRVDGLVSVPGFERFGEDLYDGAIRSGDVAMLLDPPAGIPRGRRRSRRK